MGVLRVLVGLAAVVLLTLTGCGWSPSGPEPTPPDSCTAADAPSVDTVNRAMDGLAAAPGEASWTETGRGYSRDCRLHWVQVSPSGATASSPGQVLFFDRNNYLGTPTPDPKPYLTVLAAGDDTVTLQYQWLQGDEPNCCPTGIGTVRFTVGEDGRLKSLDPVPVN